MMRRGVIFAGVAAVVVVLLALVVFAVNDDDDTTSGTSTTTTEATNPPRPCTPPAAGTPSADEMVVTVFYSCGEAAPTALKRIIPKTTGVLRATLDALLEGPSAKERAAGFTSFFSSSTAGMVTSVSLSSKGEATVDFADLRPVIPNASASAGSQLLLSQLNATIFQFPSVRTVVYRIDGNCEAFTEWLQIGGCEPHTRPTSSDPGGV
jgi:hypothetical protein